MVARRGQRRCALPRRPLFDDHAEVVELADDGFDVAADHGAVFGRGRGGFGDGDHAAIGPRAGRNGGDGFAEIGEAQLELLAARGRRAEHGSLPYRAGVGIGQNDAQRERVGADRKKRIGPRSRVVDIDIEAFGGQRDQLELGALLVALGGRLPGPGARPLRRFWSRPRRPVLPCGRPPERRPKAGPWPKFL